MQYFEHQEEGSGKPPPTAQMGGMQRYKHHQSQQLGTLGSSGVLFTNAYTAAGHFDKGCICMTARDTHVHTSHAHSLSACLFACLPACLHA